MKFKLPVELWGLAALIWVCHFLHDLNQVTKLFCALVSILGHFQDSVRNACRVFIKGLGQEPAPNNCQLLQ